MRILEKWFKHFENKDIKLPSNLDFYIILTLTQKIFKSQHAFAITNVLNFWYNYFEIITLYKKKEFLNLVIKNFFYFLFLHWSKNIREVFHHFICYRLIYWFETSEDYNVRKLVYKFNEYLNIIEKCSNLYKREMFRWGQLRSNKKYKTSFKKLMVNIEQEGSKIYFGIDDLKDMLGLKKFKVREVDYRRKDSSISALSKSMDNLSDIEEKTFNAKKIRGTFVEETKMAITKKKFVYCQRSLEEFADTLSKYKQDFKAFSQNRKQQLPRLVFKIPIDKFEFIEEDDSRW